MCKGKYCALHYAEQYNTNVSNRYSQGLRIFCFQASVESTWLFRRHLVSHSSCVWWHVQNGSACIKKWQLGKNRRWIRGWTVLAVPCCCDCLQIQYLSGYKASKKQKESEDAMKSSSETRTQPFLNVFKKNQSFRLCFSSLNILLIYSFQWRPVLSDSHRRMPACSTIDNVELFVES